MLSTSRSAILRHNLLNYKRFRHKVNKQLEDKPEPKAAADVMDYLGNSAEYKEIIDKVPKSLLKKYKTPETMYLINKKTAKNITETLINYINKDAPIVEINPGFGFLTRELLQCQKNPIYLYEISNHFSQFLTEIQSQFPDRIHFKSGDFFGMWKLAFKDKLDDGNRLQELLGDLATDDNGSAYDLQTVNIQGCGMRLPCFVTLGDRIPVNVRFLADFASRQLDQDVTIQINFVQARTPVTPEPCETVMCPVRTDAETAFTSVMSVPTGMALNQRGFLQWQVYNEMGRRVLCYRVMVQTQNFLQKFLRQYLVDLLDARVEKLGESISRDTFNNYTARYFNSSLLVSKLMSNIKANFH